MANDIKAKITRRAFIEGGFAVSALISLPQITAASKYSKDSADGLLSLEADGKIHLYSGGGNMGIYAQDDMFAILKGVFNCSSEHFIIENGLNPDHLPILLNQFSNHLSFSNAKTNKYSALLLIGEIKTKMVEIHGGAMKDYHIKNGQIFGNGVTISFADLSHLADGCLIKGHICQNTVLAIAKIKKNSLIIAVAEML